MLPSGNKKRAFVLDYSVVNNVSACFNIIQENFLLGDVFINYDFILSSSNNKLKKYIVENGVKISNGIVIAPCLENIDIDTNIDNKIIIEKKSNWNMTEEYNTLLQQDYEPKVMTLSMDTLLECKMKNIECNLYTNDSDGRIGIYTDNNSQQQKQPKPNQFKYDNENKTLEKFTGIEWINIDNVSLYGFNPLTYKQKAYLDLLLDDKISLVLCSGSAGTGKTFMAFFFCIQKKLQKKKTG